MSLQRNEIGGVTSDAAQALRRALDYLFDLVRQARGALTNLLLPGPPLAPGAQLPDKAGKLPETPIFKDKSAGRVPYVAARIRKAFPSASGLGRPIHPWEEQVLLSMAWLESGVANDSPDADGPRGSWWTRDMIGSGNPGGLQCFVADINQFKEGKQRKPHYRCAPYGDKKQLPDGTWQPYTTLFRYFVPSRRAPDGSPAWEGPEPMTAADGAAWEFVREVYKQRPKGGEAIAAHKSIDEIAQALRVENYHGAPPAAYAKAIWSHLPDVAKILGQPVAFQKPASVAGVGEGEAGLRARRMPSGEIVWYKTA
jgi:hypothetical protein